MKKEGTAISTLLTDPQFRRHTYVVLDFETLTPKGRSPEPIEVAAIVLHMQEENLVETDRFESLIRPPDDVPVTSYDTLQTGLTAQLLATADPAAVVMAALDARLGHPPFRIVAHNAPHEAALIAQQRAHCPTLAAASLLDTVQLARRVYRELPSHRLDDVLRLLKIPQPLDRHRAMPDVEATVAMLRRILSDGAAAGHWSSLHDIDKIAGRAPTTTRRTVDDQGALF